MNHATMTGHPDQIRTAAADAADASKAELADLAAAARRATAAGIFTTTPPEKPRYRHRGPLTPEHKAAMRAGRTAKAKKRQAELKAERDRTAATKAGRLTIHSPH